MLKYILGCSLLVLYLVLSFQKSVVGSIETLRDRCYAEPTFDPQVTEWSAEGKGLVMVSYEYNYVIRVDNILYSGRLLHEGDISEIKLIQYQRSNPMNNGPDINFQAYRNLASWSVVLIIVVIVVWLLARKYRLDMLRDSDI
jgi:hypothetical protein